MQNNSWLKTLNRDEARARRKEAIQNIVIFLVGVAVIVVVGIFWGN